VKKTNRYELFGIFNQDEWLYAALLNGTRTHFIPIMLLPFHKFYLDILNNPDSPENACGPYTVMLDSWKSVGMDLKAIQFVLRANGAGQTLTHGAFKLQMTNDIGTQIGLFQSDPTDAVIIHVMSGIPIQVNNKTMEGISVELSETDMDDEQILNEIEERMADFKKQADAYKDSMKHLGEESPNEETDESV